MAENHYRPPPPGEFHDWQGKSGNWYMHTVHPFSRYSPYEGANYIFVRRDTFGRCHPIYIGQSGSLRQRLLTHEKFDAALAVGANELHVHLLAAGESDRFRVETDLRNGHLCSLNEQPTRLGALSMLGRF